MSVSTIEESKEPETYSNSYLHGLKNNYNSALTQRKLNTEFLNIKTQVIQANSSGQTSIKYIYNYINNGSTKDYFVDLLTKLATFFSDSSISYILNTNSDITTAITAEDVSTKAEEAIIDLMALMALDTSDNNLSNSLAAVQNAKRVAQEIQRLSGQSSSTPNSATGFIPLVRTNHNSISNSDLAEYNSSNTNNTVINIIQIDWSS